MLAVTKAQFNCRLLSQFNNEFPSDCRLKTIYGIWANAIYGTAHHWATVPTNCQTKMKFTQVLHNNWGIFNLIWANNRSEKARKPLWWKMNVRFAHESSCSRNCSRSGGRKAWLTAAAAGTTMALKPRPNFDILSGTGSGAVAAFNQSLLHGPPIHWTNLGFSTTTNSQLVFDAAATEHGPRQW